MHSSSELLLANECDFKMRKISVLPFLTYCTLLLLAQGRVENSSPRPSFDQEELPQCPENFTDAGDFCYTISSKSAYPPPCPFEDLLPFETYREDINETVAPVWMPVRRNHTNGVGVLQWVEPSPFYKTLFQHEYNFIDTITNKDCLLYYNNSYVLLVSCQEEHPRVCAYTKLMDRRKQQLCQKDKQCVQSDFSTSSKCFCVESKTINGTIENKAEFLKPYQNWVYPELTNSACSMGLERINGKFVWTSSNITLDYDHWAPNAIFDETYNYGAITTKGWILTEEPFSCVLYQEDVGPFEALKLDLSFNSKNGLLNVKVHHPSALKVIQVNAPFCFTNGDFFDVVTKLDLTLVKTSNGISQFSFPPLKEWSGYYWCEAFQYPDLAVVNSNTYFLSQNPNEMVAVIQIPYNESNLLEDMGHTLRQTLLPSSCVDNYSFRLMKVLSKSEENKSMQVNIHFISKNDDHEYSDLEDCIKRSNLNLQLIDLKFCLFCRTTIDGLPGSSFPINTSIYPSDYYCFKDTERVPRLCVGDFDNGAQWSPIDNCTVLGKSSITSELMQLLQDAKSGPALGLVNLLQKPEHLSALDVYLVATNLEGLLSDDQELVEITEGVLEIDKEVLTESQVVSRATDRILQVLDNRKVGSQTVTLKNFWLVSCQPENLNGIGVLKSGADFSLVNFTTETVDEIVQMDNLEAAILLSPSLRVSAISKNSTIHFKIFFKDSLFVDASYEHVGIVFGIVLDNFIGDIPGSVAILQKNEAKYLLERNCTHWNYDITDYSGFWVRTLEPQIVSQFALCKFWTTGYFTSTSKVIKNVSSNLIQLLFSNKSAEATVAELQALSQKPKILNCNDICLFGKILTKISSKISVRAIASIVENLQSSEPELLARSQVRNSTTDLILHSIDTVIKSQSSPMQIVTENFMVFVDSNVSGLVLFDVNGSLEAQVLSKQATLDDLDNLPQLDSGVLLSPELTNQLAEDANIIITVFTTDVLFNEKRSNAKNVSKVFGVLLPSIGNYSGPVWVFHKGATGRCAHWYYDAPNNLSGFWKDESTSRSIQTFGLCEYWHTTHFALLVLDRSTYEDTMLDWITIINSSISLVGLSCIILTAILFPKWRRNTGNLILLHFSTSIILEIVSFYISTTIDRYSGRSTLCILIGIILHYAILAQFCWMLVIGLLQYRRYVSVIGGPPTHILLKSCLFGWVVPLLPVVGVLMLDRDSYTVNRTGLCYPSDLSLYLGIWFPISLIMLFNFLIFLNIICSVNNKRTECIKIGRHEMVLQWRLAVLLFFMLGMTWTFGFLSEMDFGAIFAYLFCFMATLQGFVVFLFFILFNRCTRMMYLDAVKALFRRQ